MATYNYITFPDLFVEAGRHVIEYVLCQLVEIRPQVIESARYDVIRRDVISELPRPAPYDHQITSLGSVTRPKRALAAAVAGDARMIWDSGLPILPRKFLFAVDMVTSPFPGIPE
ncbi:MAG: hypothetical protein A4E57_03482 [Syntrophorhabdaceae bacterium PtaU1.Bin034]|nr:MAG: hypothetical protein A4E57_03482 [Syntrophorhabdaceae bacterium PtaU1.Bin034]